MVSSVVSHRKCDVPYFDALMACPQVVHMAENDLSISLVATTAQVDSINRDCRVRFQSI